MKHRAFLAASAGSLIALSAPAAAQTIVAPTSAVINAGGPGFGSINDTRNQSGLASGYTSGVTDFDTYIATNPIHTLAFSGFEWFSELDSTSATVTYDFGAALGIDRLALWNEEASGIGSLNLLSSLDGLSFTSFGTFAPQNNPDSDYPAEVFSFGALETRFVRFEMSGCPQANSTFNACAIGEVAFRTAEIAGGVPEPTTWAMMIVGFGAVGGAVRRRNQVVTRVNFA